MILDGFTMIDKLILRLKNVILYIIIYICLCVCRMSELPFVNGTMISHGESGDLGSP